MIDMLSIATLVFSAYIDVIFRKRDIVGVQIPEACRLEIKTHQQLYIYSLFCFVLWHIILIGRLMPNQVKENKSEKKFKGEVLGINDKL